MGVTEEEAKSPKCVVVPMSALREHGRWDAKFHIAMQTHKTEVARLVARGRGDIVKLVALLPWDKNAWSKVAHAANETAIKDWPPDEKDDPQKTLPRYTTSELALYVTLAVEADLLSEKARETEALLGTLRRNAQLVHHLLGDDRREGELHD